MKRKEIMYAILLYAWLVPDPEKGPRDGYLKNAPRLKDSMPSTLVSRDQLPRIYLRMRANDEWVQAGDPNNDDDDDYVKLL